MSINESQQTLPLSNSINLNLGQIQHIRIQQNPSPEIGTYMGISLQQQQQLGLQQSNQNFLNELEAIKMQQQQLQQKPINQSVHSSQHSRKDQMQNLQEQQMNFNQNQDSFNPFIIQKNQTPPLLQSGRETPFSNFLSSDQHHMSNQFIPQVQLIRPNQQGDQDERFMSSSPLQEIQSFYLNHNNPNESPIPQQQQQQIYNQHTFEDRYNYQQQQNGSQFKPNSQENLVQKLTQLSNSAAASRKSQENNKILVQSNSSNKSNKADQQLNQQQEQHMQQQIQQQQNNLQYQVFPEQNHQEDDDNNNILQRLEREEQFQQKIENMKLTKQQLQQKQLEEQLQSNQDPLQTQAIYNVGIGAKQFDEIEMLVQRESYENQLTELNDESDNLYSEAIQFVNLQKQKDQEMDKELVRQRKELEEFRRKINEMKSTELTGGNVDGNESILLKKMDLQKLLFKIEDLKYQVQHNSKSQSPSKSHGKSPSQNRSFFQNPDEQIKKKAQMNASNSQLLMNFMNGKNYLSPKNYLEATERIMGKSVTSTTTQSKYTLTPPRYGLKATKIGGNSNNKSQQNHNYSMTSISSKGGYKNYPIKSDQKDYYGGGSNLSPNIIITNFNNQVKQSQQNENTISQFGNTTNTNFLSPNGQMNFENTPQKNNQFSNAMQRFQNSENQQNPSEVLNDHQQRNLSSNKKSTNNSFFNNSPINKKMSTIMNNFQLSPASNHSNCTLGKNGFGGSGNRFEHLENNIFLVQSKTVNSPIISLLGKDRLIVARPFKGTLQKTGSNRVITDGETYSFEKISMIASQITKNLKSEILIRNALENHFKNIFIIGTKSSQKKAIQLDVLQLLKETFRTKILTMISNNYACRVKLRYCENVFENPTTVSKLPTSPSFPQSQSQHQDKSYPIQDDIGIEFNPLDVNIEDKILILDEAIQRIAELIIDNRKSKIPQNKQNSSSYIQNFMRSKVRTVKLSLAVFSNASVVCKQSYRVSSSNYIIDPDRRTPLQIFKESYHLGSSSQQNQYPPTFRSFVGGVSQQQLQQKSQHQIVGFKEDTILNDDNIVIFSCAPILKYFEQVRALFKSAHTFEKYCRKLNKQQN